MSHIHIVELSMLTSSVNKCIRPFLHTSHTTYPRLFDTPNFLHVHMDCDSLGTSKDREAERDDRGWSDGEKKKIKRKRARCFVNKVQSNIKKPLSIASSMFPSQEDYRYFLYCMLGIWKELGSRLLSGGETYASNIPPLSTICYIHTIIYTFFTQ